MSAHRSAWISWFHHAGMDVLDGYPDCTIKDLMEKAFEAGWKNAGGDQRLEAVDEIGQKIHGCCGFVKAQARCTSCQELKRLLKTLGAAE